MATTGKQTRNGFGNHEELRRDAAVTIADQDVRQTSAARIRRLVLLIDGVFLAVSGAVTGTFELLGYNAGTGPLADVFHDSPYTIGWVENHGFAFLVGMLFILVARVDGRRFWHGFALAVHVLLGTANLMFWNSFVTFDTVRLGVAATIAHAVFIVAQGLCFASWRPERQSGR